MIRLFSILFALTTILMLLSSGGVFWLNQDRVKQNQEQAVKAVAEGLAVAVNHQLAFLQKMANVTAQREDVIAALQSHDPEIRQTTAALLDQQLPGVLKVRLLPPHVNELDTSVVPQMGNADLVMVRDTLKSPQKPTIQDVKEHRHLAVTAVVKSEETILGVVLISLNYDFLAETFKTVELNKGFIELKQDNAVLAKTGDPALKNEDNNAVKIKNSNWTVNYWPDLTLDNDTFTMVVAFILVPVVVLGFIIFIIYNKQGEYLLHDRHGITRMVKDLLSGKNPGSYEMKTKEMQTLVTTLVQFKRVLDHQTLALSEDYSDNTEIDDFFNEDNTSESDLLKSMDNQEKPIETPISPPNQEQNLATTRVTKPIDLNQASGAEVSGGKNNIFRAYDIRGIAGQTLTKDVVYDIGRALGSDAHELGVKTIIVGRDGRLSSPGLAEALAKGIVTTGVNVLDIGLVPTPVVYFVAHHTEGRSGVMITGSHNPADYNGLKMVIHGETYAEEKIQSLSRRIEIGNFVTGTEGTIQQNNMFTNEYIGIISEDVHMVRPMKVVVDCGNGAASQLAPVLLKTLGCEVIELFCEVDGNFPNHHPDPSQPENLKDLITAVKHYEADVGLAFDGDGDRLGVIDSKGKIIWADRQMMLFAKDVLSMKPGAEIIFDVKCSRHLAEQIVKHGGRPLMWKTGHSLMKAKLKETGAALAGEMSGHIFFNDRWFGFDDALYSAARLIEILSNDTRGSDEVFADFPDSFSTPEINVELQEGENKTLIAQLIKNAKFEQGKTVHIDGLRVDFPDGWGLVRASNTMPVLVLRFEGDTQDALERIKNQFADLLKKTQPDIRLPF